MKDVRGCRVVVKELLNSDMLARAICTVVSANKRDLLAGKPSLNC
jgi:hypothetical protein